MKISQVVRASDETYIAFFIVLYILAELRLYQAQFILVCETSFRYNADQVHGFFQYKYWYWFFRTNSNCLQIASALSNKSAKAVISADSTERATRCDLYAS